jgi:tetratricopeptide (TPR) repeat protein
MEHLTCCTLIVRDKTTCIYATVSENVRIFYDDSLDDEAEACLTEGIAQAQATGDPWTIAWCLRQAIGWQGHRGRHHAPSAAAHEEAIRRAEETGDPFLVCQVHLSIGIALQEAGDRAAAEAPSMEALRIARATDDKWSTFETLNLVAGNYLAMNRLREAKRYYGEELRTSLDLGVMSFPHWSIGGFDWIARKEGRMERAALLRAAAVRWVGGDLEYVDDRGSMGPPLVIDEATDRERWALARSMTIDEIVDYALSDRD